MEVKNKKVAYNKLSQDDVILQFKEVHGEDFDYSKVIYVSTNTPVEVYCKKHDFIFTPTPKNHKNGGKCYYCGREAQIKKAKKDYNFFLGEMVNLYGDYYDFSKVNYINSKIEIDVICRKHGLFEKRPCELVKGHGCPECKLQKSKYNNRDIFIEENKKIFGDITDFSLVGKISAMTKIDLSCTVHNHQFNILVSNRLGGQKCPKCAEENYSLIRKKTTEQFIEEAKEIYGELHDYKNTVYTGCRKELEVRCKKHNSTFKAFPNSYLDGYTCFKCRKEDTGYKAKHHHTKEGYMYLANNRTTYLYLIKCFNKEEEFYKIGKTFRTFNERFTKTSMPYKYEVVFTYSGSADKIWDLEEKLHKKYKSYKHKVKIIFDGYSECYNLKLPINEVINHE
jgi:hypothetical protein